MRIIIFAALTFAFSATAAEQPNVLFIISDDLSAEALGAYGNQQCATPNIDRLAQEGVVFTRAYCQFPICGPSRAALMAGMYPEALGIMSNGQSDRFEASMGTRPSLAEHFRNNGYHSARTSKIYHMRVPGDITAGVDGPDHPASWSERYNFRSPEWMTEGEHEHLSNERLRFERGIHYGLGFGSAFYVVRGAGDGSEQPDMRAVSKAIEIMEAEKANPFFLAVGLVRPHVPFVAPEAYFEDYEASRMNLPEKIEGDWDDIPNLGRTRSSRSLGIEGQLLKQQKALAAYYACVTFMDAQVGRLLDALENLGLRDDTIVVFTSDHGYHLGEHDLWQKVSLHEESMRIPLIISAPGFSVGTTDAIAEQIDLYPTFSEMAGLSVPEHCQGVSLLPVLAFPTSTVREDAYGVTGKGRMLRTARWAYILYEDGEEELYDMVADPGQYTNLARSEEFVDTLELMRRRLEGRTESSRKPESSLGN